jgi:hypothetical protein
VVEDVLGRGRRAGVELIQARQVVDMPPVVRDPDATERLSDPSGEIVPAVVVAYEVVDVHLAP